MYNEIRASDPATHGELPPDYLTEEVLPGQSLVFNDGYNCNVNYDEDTQTLRFTGGVGFGLGAPASNPWDDTDEDLDAGLRGINGVNNLGTVPMEAGSGVHLDTTVPGILKIRVRNQGDIGCPPE